MPLPIYKFGEFRVDVEEETLWRNEEIVHINRHTFQVLRLLIENSGKIVSKQKFFETVWADTFVADNSLTVNMTTLRHILGDTAKDAKFIENISRKGYRFIAKVEEIAETENVETLIAFVSAGEKQFMEISEICETRQANVSVDEINKSVVPRPVSFWAKAIGSILAQKFYSIFKVFRLWL